MSLVRLNRFLGRMVRVRPTRIAARRPVASISFDDFPKSAWQVGGAVLAAHKVRGTYYTAGNFCGRTVNGTVFYDEADLRALGAAGHEIACHGFGHQPVPSLSRESLAADIERNARFLAPFLGGERPRSYAYPYGAVSVRSKRFCGSLFSNLRGVHPGINAGTVDLAQLNAVSLEMRSFSRDAIARAIARAQHDNGWICFYTHGVSDNPGAYDSTPEMLAQALALTAQARIEMLPMHEALGVALGA